MTDYLEVARRILVTMPNPPEGNRRDETEARGVSWAHWKAAALNRLFQEQGTLAQPGRITAATVRHGEPRTIHDGKKL